MSLSLTKGSAGQDEQLLAAPGLASLPRVNLMPREIAEARRFRRVQAGLGAGVLAAVGVVGLLVVLANASVASAQEELTLAQAEQSRLQAETATYADVTAVYAQAAAAQAMLTEAMGQEVRYSRFLSDLSLTVPENVWVRSLTFSQTAVPPSLGSAEPGIGTVSVSGVGFSHDDVAAWLDSLAGQQGYADPYFSLSTEAKIGPRTVVEFESTATLTPAALSGGYTAPAGG